MKTALLILISMISLSALATVRTTQSHAKICGELRDEAESRCVATMCDDLIADGTYTDENECRSGSDYDEAAQVICEDILPDLVAAYNSANPTAKLTCEEE